MFNTQDNEHLKKSEQTSNYYGDTLNNKLKMI